MTISVHSIFSRGHPKIIPPLVTRIEQARQDWLNAYSLFNVVPNDPSSVDYTIFLINAYERRYMDLIKQARQDGIRYSPWEVPPEE